MTALLQLAAAVALLAVAAAFWSASGPDDHVRLPAAGAACLCAALVMLRALMRLMSLARWLLFVPLSAGVVVLSLIGALR